MTGTNTAGAAIPELRSLERRLLAAGGIGLLVSLIGFAGNRPQFYQSYLVGYMWCLGASLGCLALGMIDHLSGGAWGVVARPVIGAGTRVLPVLTILFLPVVFGREALYSWLHVGAGGHDEILAHKTAYLNLPFFLARAAVYFVVWNALSYFLNRWSLEQDRVHDPQVARKMQRLSAGGLLLYSLTMTFAAFDWLMSLEPHWYSTIYGVLVMGGQGLTALAVLILVLAWLGRRSPLDRVLSPAHFHDLGNLLMAFVMLWAYFSFSQFLIIWGGNLPAEIGWYVSRIQTSWKVVAVGLIGLHFALPFVLLVSRAVKRAPETLAKVAAWVVLIRLMDLLWQVHPTFHPGGLFVGWLDAVLPASLGLIWAGCFVWQLRQRVLIPLHVPDFREALGVGREVGRVEAGH